jgi:hypothetical protein
LVQPESEVVRLDAQAERVPIMRPGAFDQGLHERASDTFTAGVGGDAHRDLGRLLVDEPVRVLGLGEEAMKCRADDRDAPVLVRRFGDDRAVARARARARAEAEHPLLELGVRAKRAGQGPLAFGSPEERLEQHGLEYAQIVVVGLAGPIRVPHPCAAEI